MSLQHFVRVGAMGQVGRFASVDARRYPRGTHVICRTSRGTEVGQVLTVVQQQTGRPDGTLLRGMTVEDQLLLARLEKHRDAALRDCAQLLQQRNLPAMLIEVEHLFDGQSLFFYFLGDVTPELELLTGELAEAYQARVQFRKFSRTLAQGCGPGCGTDEAAGDCSTSGCASCVVSGLCSSQSGR